jgi:DNA-binding CsgD family transcriptional regulator
MNQVVRDRLRADERLTRVAAALGRGVVLLDSNGRIAWMDKRIGARLNGAAEQFAEALRTLDGQSTALRCSLSAADVTVNGETLELCGLRELPEANDNDSSFDLVSALENALSDGSWFTRAIVDKLKAVYQARRTSASASDLDMLTDREREVLGHICDGRSDAEMGRLMNLSQNTVRNHIAALYRKIGVNRCSAAVIWARERAITSGEALGSRRRARPNRMEKE